MKLPRENHTWSESEENILIRYFLTGEDISLLSKRLLRNTEEIEKKLVELGWLSPASQTDQSFDDIEQGYLTEPLYGRRDEPAEEDIYDSEPQEDFDEWVANMRLALSGQESSSVRDSDWGESSDDFEPNDWEDYQGGPDD